MPIQCRPLNHLALIVAFAAIGLFIPAHASLAADDGRVNIRDFQEHAIDVGGENENWQPAFQAAILACHDQEKPLYVPSGVYKITEAIEITHGEGFFRNGKNISIIGDGPDHSVIQQSDPTKNTLNWSGPTYKKSMAGGSIRDIAVWGGDITINIKWHNQFNMNNCYVGGAETYGIYTEGYSSRFNDSIVRWCSQAGIAGRAHFNDIQISGFYFSRNGRGIELVGGNGVYITNSGFEQHASSAIYIQNISKPVIANCYFEGNGHKRGPEKLDIGLGYPSSIHLDGTTNSVVIENNIFRGGQGYATANQINIAACEGARIRGNLFSNAKVAIMFLDDSHTTQKRIGSIMGLKIEDNSMETRDKVLKLRGEPGLFLVEAAPGLIDQIKANGSVIEEPMILSRKNHHANE